MGGTGTTTRGAQARGRGIGARTRGGRAAAVNASSLRAAQRAARVGRPRAVRR